MTDPASPLPAPFGSKAQSPGKGVSFDVSPVERARTPLLESPRLVATQNLLTKPDLPETLIGLIDELAMSGDPEAAGILKQLRERAPRTIEACSQYSGSLVANVSFHPVMAAAHLAFSGHRPLVLSPDILWLLILQGFANHVNAHSESVRKKLVAHEGQLTLRVRRDDFVRGAPENPWAEVITAFQAQVREYLGPAASALTSPDFSTTGPAEAAAAGAVLLDAVQTYFNLDFLTLCGIPEVTLLGTTDDWNRLARRTDQLGQFDLQWWTEILRPILAEFVNASVGKTNLGFWRSLYKVQDMSGGPYATGWLAAFFPYLWNRASGRADRRSHWFSASAEDLESLLHPPDSRLGDRIICGLKAEDLPSGLSSAPFRWQYLDREHSMEFLGGFVGVHQEESTMRLKPEIGWAIRAVPANADSASRAGGKKD